MKKYELNPHKTLSPYFSQPVVYNLNVPRESFSWEEIQILYKTYFACGLIPIKSKIEGTDSTAHDISKDQYAMIYLVMHCQSKLIDSNELIGKIERYSKWNQILCNFISLHSSTT
ncbi:hypothetical protein LCGC14_1364820 [marine sediment metagenome]|uniref:Uncharacterized protein n=1 Tax=marine sediment metagenome TaxID=412755 RepID=A0A0F9N960_9ZZZZ